MVEASQSPDIAREVVKQTLGLVVRLYTYDVPREDTTIPSAEIIPDDKTFPRNYFLDANDQLSPNEIVVVERHTHITVGRTIWHEVKPLPTQPKLS